MSVINNTKQPNQTNKLYQKNILTIQTLQIAPIRTLMSALKDILLETNIVFTKEGIKIINMDKSHTILVHLNLEAKNFELYECKMDKIVIGVNVFHLFKLIILIITYFYDSFFDSKCISKIVPHFMVVNFNRPVF